MELFAQVKTENRQDARTKSSRKEYCLAAVSNGRQQISRDAGNV